MESGVKHGHLGHRGSDDAIHGVDRGQLKWSMGRGELGHLGYPGANLRRDQNTFAIFRTSVHDAVANHVDPGRRIHHLRLPLPESVEHRLQESRGRVGVDRSFYRSATRSNNLDVR